MFKVRKSQERGHAQHGWLDTRYTFSFSNYYDPAHMGFRDLRVINEDQIAPAEGFPTHAHRDMEIITYVVSGQLEHKDSMGNGSVIRPGEVQHMSAGAGVTHSEFNASQVEPVHLLQIWILPEQQGSTPRYGQKDFSEQTKNRLALVASKNGREGSLSIHQQVNLYVSKLDSNMTLSHSFFQGRHGWLQLVHGQLELSGTTEEGQLQAQLHAGDGVSISNMQQLNITSTDESEFLLFDLA